MLPFAVASIGTAGPHGLSEILYAYTSAAANNGSAFGGLTGNTPWYNTTLGIAMLLGRFAYVVPVMAIAGSLAAKVKSPASAGTFPTDGPLFVGLLIGIILILGGLQFLPALVLGPIVEHFAMLAGLLDPSILFPAIRDAFVKLDPRKLLRNPVIFVTEIVAVVVTILFIRDLASNPGEAGFSGQIAAWLWFTVLFATFAEAVAEGRGRAQADSLKKTKSELVARRLVASGKTERIPASSLKVGDVVLVAAGELVPGDGEVIEGVASVNESAITGESAPVI
eukprot:gene11595-15488_t